MKNLRNIFLALTASIIASYSFASAPFTGTFSENAINFETPPGRPDFKDVSICRLQIQVKTNSFDGAQTDDPVSVRLNTRDNPFYLNLSHNDRERNRTDTYDVLTPYVNKIKDIQFIQMKIHGSDGWNVREIKLIVNNVTIYTRKFSNGYWLDTDNSKRQDVLYIPVREMKKSPNYRYNNVTGNIWRGPTMVPKSFIDDLVESSVGNALRDVKKVSWGKKQGKYYISSKRINDNTLRFDLDLSYDVTGAPNVEIDVDFDLVFTCENGVVRTTVKNYKTSKHGLTQYLIKNVLPKLKKALYAKCAGIPEPVTKVACFGGVWAVGYLLDFSFDYDNPISGEDIGLNKDCTTALTLNANGDLVLGKKTTYLRTRAQLSKRPKIANGK